MGHFISLRKGAALVLASAVCLGVACHSQSAGSKSPPPAERRALVMTLSSKDLLSESAHWPTAALPPDAGRARPDDYTPIPQNQPLLGGDLPHFSLFQPAGAPAFWLRKTEGPAGAATWYGPLRMSAEGNIVPAR